MSDEPRKLGRAELLKGADDTQEVSIRALGGATIEIRPLTSGQFAQVDAIRNRGTKLEGQPVMDRNGNPDMENTKFNLSINMEDMTSSEFEADALAVFYGVVGDYNWTVDEVKQIKPAGAVSEIARKIYQASGVMRSQREALDRFRKEPGRSEDGEAEPDGVSAGSDAGGANSRAGGVPADGDAAGNAGNARAGKSKKNK